MKEEKKRILQMVQEGTITAEEAMGILEELEKAGKESEQKEQVLVNELSTVVLDKERPEQEKLETGKKTLTINKEKIFGFVETAIQKIKDTDLDFNFGSSVEVSHIFQDHPSVLKELAVGIANGGVTITAWNQPEVRVECAAKVYRRENQDEAREEFIKNCVFTSADGKLDLQMQQRTIKLEAAIFIPAQHLEEISVRLFNGAIKGNGLRADKLKLKTANGPILLQDLHAGGCEAETGNGKISMERAQCTKVEAESLNGAITLNGNFRNVEAQSFNGQVASVNLDPECESIQAKTVTGSIQLQLPAGIAADGELKSNLGGFNVELGGIDVVEEKSEVIQKVLKFKTKKEQPAGLFILADTKTGSITIR